MFAGGAQGSLKTGVFGGIVQSVDENELKAAPSCYTPRGVNFWIDNGNLRVRNDYEPVTKSNISLNDGYTYKIISMFVHAPGDQAKTILLAGCDAYAGGARHHCVLLARKLDMSDDWVKVQGNTARSFAANQDIYFSSADFTFVNYTGDFYENGGSLFATILSNGHDAPMIFAPTSLSFLKSDGWKPLTTPGSSQFHDVNYSTDNFVDGDSVQFISTTLDLPAGIASGRNYYICQGDSATGTFKVKARKDDADTAIVSFPADSSGIMARITSAYSGWVEIPRGDIDCRADTIIAPDFAASNGDIIQFSYYSKGKLPSGIKAGTKYKIINFNNDTKKFKICTASDSKKVNLGSNGLNVQARQCNTVDISDDAPKGANIFVHSDRLWMTVGNTLYHNAGVYENAAHPTDWTTAGYAGNIPMLTWDGDNISCAKTLNGKPWICKENSVWSIEGNHPPYAVRQIFTAKGTIAPKSIVWYEGYLFYAAEEGILRYDGASTQPFLTQEIRNMWYTRNTSCICNVVGDTLFVYGLFYHPVTGKLVWGQLMVDIPTKNICWQDMNMGSPVTATNLISNGNFSGTMGWEGLNAALSASCNMLTVTGDGTSAVPMASQQTSAAWAAGHIVYARALCSATNADVQSITLKLTGATGSVTVKTQAKPVSDPVINYLLSGCVALPAGTGNISLQASGSYTDAITASGKAIRMQYASLIDLTVAFGAGFEPDAASLEAALQACPDSWFSGPASLTVPLLCNCVISPWFTTLQPNVVQPYHWFGSGSRIYRYSPTAPTGGAQALQYYFPSTDFGTAGHTKDVTWLYVTGRGGTCKITPIIDNVKQATGFTAELPGVVDVVEVPVSGVAGKAIGWVLENLGGDPIEVRDFEMHFSRMRM